MIAAWLLRRGIPEWLQELLAVAFVLALLAGGTLWALHRHDEAVRHATIAARAADDAAAMNVASAQAYADQRAMSNKFLLAQRDRFKENHDAQASIAYYRARLQSGADVLRLPAGQVCAAAPGGNPAAAGGLVGNQGPVVMPALAGDILSIAGDVAEGVRRENALIVAYNACRDQANKK